MRFRSSMKMIRRITRRMFSLDIRGVLLDLSFRQGGFAAGLLFLQIAD